MKKRTIAFMLILLLLMTQSAFAADPAAVPSCSAKGSTISAEYGNPISNRTVISFSNTTSEDVVIKSITNSNEADFSADTASEFTIPKAGTYVYPVRLKDDKEPGDYTANFTFTDANGKTYPAAVKIKVTECVRTDANPVTAEWGYEVPLIVRVKVSNFTKKNVTMVKAEAASADFEPADLTAAPMVLASKQSETFDVKLTIGKHVGVYKTTITLTDADGKTYTQEVSAEIVKKKLTIPKIVGTYVYNGQKQTLQLDENYDEALIGISEDYGSAVDAHSYAPVLYLKDKVNTIWKTADGTTSDVNQTLSWVIERYKITKPTAVPKAYVYDTTEQTFLLDNLTEQIFGKDVLTVSDDKKTNAGTTTVTVRLKDTQNFMWDDKTTAALSFPWVMKRAAIEIPSVEKASYDYDGNAHSIEFAEGSIDDALVEVKDNARTEVGTQDVTVAIKDKVNYEWNTGSDADLTFTLAIGEPVYNLPLISGTYEYNAKTQHPVLAGFDEEHMEVIDNAARNAGDHTITVKIIDKANAKWANTGNSDDQTLTWTIAKKPVTVAAKDKRAAVGDPVPALNASDYTVTGIIKPDSIGFIPTIQYKTSPDMSQEGENEIVVSGPAETADKNYSVSYQNAVLTVGKSQIKEILPTVNITFDFPLAGMKNLEIENGVDNLQIDTYFATVSFEKNQDGKIKIFEQASDSDMTDTVNANGLSENTKVYVNLLLTANSGKIIDKAKTRVNVNGIALSSTDVASLAGGAAVKIPFTTPAYRVHFSSGKGSGSMATDYAFSADMYNMPQSTFTAPSGKEFDKWQVKDAAITYAAGQKVQLTGSINLIALYKDKAVIPAPGGGGFAPSGGAAGPAGPAEITPTGEIQKPTITANNGTVVVTSKDGTAVTFTPDAGYIIMDVIVNGKSVGAFASVTNLKTGDIVECITQNKAGMQALMNNYALTARSKNVTMKNGKSAIRISWFDRNGDKMDFDGVEIQRSTKRYSGFKKMFDSNRNKYYNTNIKTGTKYYYRVRGYVLFNGEKVYTDWSLKAFRAVGK